ncbi:putative endo-beta-1,6-glucanase [Zalerion maritima]|uniref:glucan endo-1,6-beta-glucosidase n=1 Tax=Zalerion maritima TaxID=339359 RepID=A0AAD5RTR6_9PEZI|nr:putative endo-beta-1,6-glucanase [Zalerion maritima]
MLGQTSVFTLLSLAGLSKAWFPSQERASLFNISASIANPSDRRWLPSSGKIRGVNLGSLFVFEPWIASNTWSSMCGDANSEFDCVMSLGQDAANTAFQNHWGSWITESDFNEMANYGINTVRIPLGYWMKEDLVYSDSEYFPQGGVEYLKQVCGWASDRGFYIILDHHGAPGAQVANNPFTGQYASTPGFYESWQFDRAEEFLVWLTEMAHSTDEMRNVGMIEVVNEPLQGENDQTNYMRSDFYPNAYSKIRAKESDLGIGSNDLLHIQFMSSYWGSGNPNEYLDDLWFCAYDDHRYLKWDSSVAVSKDSYISTSCDDNRLAEWPSIVGEWSISVPDDVEWTDNWNPNSNTDFYSNWFAAQVKSYEQYTDGWVFWTWKTELGDYRWGYKDAVEAGIIPTSLDGIGEDVCSNY